MTLVGYMVAYPRSLVVKATLEEAISDAKVFANAGHEVAVYKLVEVKRVIPTNETNVPGPA